MTDIIEKAKRYWWVVALAFAIGGWVFMVEAGLAEGKAKDVELSDVVKQNASIMKRQQILMETLTQQVSMMWQLYLKLDDSTVTNWRKLPMYPKMDSTGFCGDSPFIAVTRDSTGLPVLGEKYLFTDTGWYVTELWDVRE